MDTDLEDTVLAGVDQYWGSLLAAFPLHTDQGRALDHSPEGDGVERLPAAFLLDTDLDHSPEDSKGRQVAAGSDQQFLDHKGEGEGPFAEGRSEQALVVLDVIVAM